MLADQTMNGLEARFGTEMLALVEIELLPLKDIVLDAVVFDDLTTVSVSVLATNVLDGIQELIDCIGEPAGEASDEASEQLPGDEFAEPTNGIRDPNDDPSRGGSADFTCVGCESVSASN